MGSSKIRIANAKAIHICNSHEPNLTPNCKRIYIFSTENKQKFVLIFKNK